MQWYSWIESTINKEVLSKILKKDNTAAQKTNQVGQNSSSKNAKETLIKVQAAAAEKEKLSKHATAKNVTSVTGASTTTKSGSTTGGGGEATKEVEKV